MTAKKSDYILTPKQRDFVTALMSNSYKEKMKQSNDYIYDLAKAFFKIDNNKEKIPSYFSNVAAYKLDDTLINNAEFEQMVKDSFAGNPKTSEIINSHPVNLEQLKKINVGSDVLEDLKALNGHSKSDVFFLAIIKNENEYILTIEKN